MVLVPTSTTTAVRTAMTATPGIAPVRSTVDDVDNQVCESTPTDS